MSTLGLISVFSVLEKWNILLKWSFCWICKLILIKAVSWHSISQWYPPHFSISLSLNWYQIYTYKTWVTQAALFLNFGGCARKKKDCWKYRDKFIDVTHTHSPSICIFSSRLRFRYIHCCSSPPLYILWKLGSCYMWTRKTIFFYIFYKKQYVWFFESVLIQ